MSVHDDDHDPHRRALSGPRRPGPLPGDAPRPHGAGRPRTAALPLVAVAAAGAACAAAAGSADAADRPLICATGAFACVLLGVTLALAASRHRMRRELRRLAEESDAASARAHAAHAESARRAAARLEAAQRATREAEVRRRTAVEAEVSLRAACKAETARSAALEGETVRFAEVTVPLVMAILHSGGSAQDVAARVPAPAGAAHRRLLDVLVREVLTGEQARAAARTACAGAAARIQALTEELHAGLRTVADRHGATERPDHGAAMLADLLTLDDHAARAGRLADGIAVLAGAPPVRRWPGALTVEDVLHGALSRIDGARQVRQRIDAAASVAGHAAEGVMHALAELLDNACAFSPPGEAVHVEVHETAAGVAVVIEDAGPGLAGAARADAFRLVSGEPLDPRILPGDGIGLAVVGGLARAYGLLVSFQGSPRGGAGAVLVVPPALLVPRPASPPALASTPEPRR